MAETSIWKADAPVSEGDYLLTPEGRQVTGNSLWFVLAILASQVMIVGFIGQYLIKMLGDGESGGTANAVLGGLILLGAATMIFFGGLDTYIKFQTSQELKKSGYTPNSYVAKYRVDQG